MLSSGQIDRLLRLTSFEYCDLIWWRLGEPTLIDGEYVTPDPDLLIFLVGCNDVFAWGTADCERINDEDDLAGLEAAVRECEAILGRYRGGDGFPLWVARKRGMRPQGAMYQYLDKELHHLFDACGPARETDFLNPKPQPVETRPLSELVDELEVERPGLKRRIATDLALMDAGAFRVEWSDEDGEWVATCAGYPSLSWLAPTSTGALQGLERLIGEDAV